MIIEELKKKYRKRKLKQTGPVIQIIGNMAAGILQIRKAYTGNNSPLLKCWKKWGHSV